ncbi:MAG: hypothetical protein ACI8WB_001116, partial [Phenylobacterium sp.]
LVSARRNVEPLETQLQGTGYAVHGCAAISTC